MTPEVWGPERVDDLAALWNVAAPGEPLTADELAGVCFDDPGVVLATPDGLGVVAAVIRTHPSARPDSSARSDPFPEPDPGPVVVGHVRLVVVHPDARRQGVGHQLVQAAEQWLVDQGVMEVVLGAEAPVYLWPGVDTKNIAAQCLAESAGYVATGSEINMELPSTFRAPVPDTVVIRRLTADADVAATRSLVAEVWPQWLVEFDLGVAAACVHGAFVDPATVAGDALPVALGFCAHSVLRTGWLGPMGTDPSRQGGGVGSALVSAVATDVMVAGLPQVQISWVGPVQFYTRLGATVSATYRSYAKQVPAGEAKPARLD